MIINHNMQAMNTHRQLGVVGTSQSKSMEKLSSGYRINRAGDDAAGLAISEKMRGQIRGLSQASRNSQDGISLIQTAEGALNETHSILQRMRELAVQAASDTNTASDREKVQSEIDQLTSEINRIGNTTEFNTMSLLDGSRSVTSRVATTTLRTVALSGTSTINFADGVTTSGAELSFVDGEIVFGAGEATDYLSGADASAEITVRVYASGVVTVSMVFDASADDTVKFSATETIAFTAGEDFTYNHHGISFTIQDLAASSAIITLDTNVGTSGLDVISTGSAGVQMDWSGNTTGAVTVTDVTYALDAEVETAKQMKVDVSADGLTVTVELFADTAGATSLVKDEFLLSAAGALSYDAHGITFDITTVDVSGGSNSSSQFTIDFETQDTYSSPIATDNSLSFQIGANEKQSMSLSLEDMRAVALGISSNTAGVDGEAGYRASKAVTNGTDSTAAEYALDVSTFEAAGAAVTKIEAALEKVSSERSKLGAVQNRLEHTIANLDTSAENLQASESRIRDVDMAKEMMAFTKNNILMQAAQSMLAQANQAPQGVLSLLR